MGGNRESKADREWLESLSGKKPEVYNGYGSSYNLLAGKYNTPSGGGLKKGGRGLLGWYDEEVIAPLVDWLWDKFNRGSRSKKVGWGDVGNVIGDAMKK